MLENRKNEDVLYKLSPKFNIIYELFMPTGRKIKSTIIMLIIMCIAAIFFFGNSANMNVGDIMFFGNMSVLNLLSTLLVIVNIALLIKLNFHIIFQIMQYKHITYTFYQTHMVYEDDFLNQHRKNIEYSNVKEVEIRRTIIDRILGFGVIVIYTNAENNRNNGLVIYAIRNPKHSYEIIDEIIHKVKEQKEITKENFVNENSYKSNLAVDTKNEEIKEEQHEIEIEQNNISNEDYSSESERQRRIEENQKEEENFLNSLKNINEEVTEEIQKND